MSNNITPFDTFQFGSSTAARASDAQVYTHPADVASDPQLTKAEKRAILASWISDARAVEGAPALRLLDSGAVVDVDAILRVLRSLDEPTCGKTQQRRRLLSSPHQRRVVSRWLRRITLPHSNDDEDDPPPAPAGLAAPFRPSFVGAYGAHPERLIDGARV